MSVASKPNNLQEYSEQFAVRFPETGEVKAGSKLTGEQVAKLGEVFSTKITQLSRKEALTQREATFVDTVADIASRSIVWTLGSRGLKAPQGTATEPVVDSALRVMDSWPMPRPLNVGMGHVTSSAVVRTFEQLTGGAVGLRQRPELRPQIEDMAQGLMPYLGEIAKENDGIVVDDYLQGNLQYLLAQYEMTEAESAVASQAVAGSVNN